MSRRPSHQFARAKARPKVGVNIYIACLAILGLLLLSLADRSLSGLDWAGLGLFVIIVILTEWLSIDIYARNTAVSTSAAPILAGALLFGAPGAVVLSLTFATVALIKYRSPISRLSSTSVTS